MESGGRGDVLPPSPSFPHFYARQRQRVLRSQVLGGSLFGTGADAADEVSQEYSYCWVSRMRCQMADPSGWGVTVVTEEDLEVNAWLSVLVRG